MGRSRRKPPAGWVRAPTVVELEIRNVWQEDEMPDELKNSPGYRPFTLGGEAQAWVDSMTDVMDGGDAVFGRPRSTGPVQHPSLASSPPPAQSPGWPSAPAPSPPSPWTVSPPVSPSPGPNPPPAARVLMPDIETRAASTPPPRTLPPRVMMPEIGDEEIQQGPEQAQRATMPDIAGPDAAQQTHPKPQMPDIAGPEAPRERQKRPQMPDIAGDEERVEKQRSVMPDIG